MRNTQQGLSKFELAVVLAMLALLSAALLGRLAEVERESERLEVSLAIRNMRTGLKLAVGERVMHGEEFRIAELLDENPLNFLDTQQIVGASGTASQPGEWAYSPVSRVLSYQPRQPEAFEDRELLTWRMEGSKDSLGRMLDLHLAEFKR